MPSAMVGEVFGFLILLSKILEEIGRVMKRKGGSGDSSRKKNTRFLGWRDGES